MARIVRDSRCGFVIAPGDVESTSRAVRQLALDSELRKTMGQQARRYYAEKFGRKRSVAQIIDVIEHAGGKGQSDHPTGKRGVGRMPREEPNRRSVVRAVLHGQSSYARLWPELPCSCHANAYTPVCPLRLLSEHWNAFPCRLAIGSAGMYPLG